MITLTDIKAPVAVQMQQYEGRLKEWLHTDYKAVADVLKYIVTTRGKGIRPLLVILSHALNASDKSAETQDRAYLGAMLIEMIHTASLLHDDVIDEAYIRRGKPSVNALWRSRTAILAGDYILAKSYTVGLEAGNADIVAYITQAMGALCEGELIQSSQSEKLEMTRKIYLDIIYKKTASLIGASSASGALAARATQEQVGAMKAYGDKLGLAFQIKDDILDFSTSAKTGKSSCTDLREKKITLPLLTVLENASPRERNRLLALLADIRNTPANEDYLYRAVIDYGGIQAAEKIMMEYVEQAKSLLSIYPDSAVKRSMTDLCDFVHLREK